VFAGSAGQQRVAGSIATHHGAVGPHIQGRIRSETARARRRIRQVSTKISQIGMQLRGVREIFSTLRENLDQVLGGLDDGLAPILSRWPRRNGQSRRRAVSVHAG
jgi:hypothetical protein